MDSVDAEDAILSRALAYPYDVPTHSYVFANGEPLPWTGFDLDDGLAGLTPVLAYGSNSSPEQLRRKFHALTGDLVIPVIKIWLHDFDVVYAALIASYGSVPATLQYSPGTRSHVFLTYLSAEALERMHETENTGDAYEFGELRSVKIAMEYGPAPDACWAYVSLHGCLSRNGSCVALEGVHADGRVLASASQAQAQEYAIQATDGEPDISSFVLRSVRDAGERTRRIATLRRNAIPFTYPHWHAAEGAGVSTAPSRGRRQS